MIDSLEKPQRYRKTATQTNGQTDGGYFIGT